MKIESKDLLFLFEQLITSQRKKLYQIGSEIVPKITDDDLLQPNDFPELESHPYFRYEEGVLEGLLTIKTAVLAYIADRVN